MGRLQELLHDDAESIQNSAGLTSVLSRPTGVNEDRMSPYEGLRTMTAMPRRLLSANRTLDPIKRLPPELATLFIRNALALHNHSSRIIELTTVSKLWQSFLCSTPVFWSELVIDETEEDFLATLSVFMALSGNVSLKLTFPRNPIDWTGLAPLLLPVTQRITGLRFEGYDYAPISWISSMIPTVLVHLGHLSHLKEVDFDRFTWEGGNLLRTASLMLPSTVKLRGDFQIETPEACRSSGTPNRFFNIIKYNTFGTLEPTAALSNSFHLRYSVVLPNNITIRSNDATPPQLESLAGRLAEGNCFEQVVYRTARHLQYLNIVIHLSQVQDAIDCLRLLMRLQKLELHIEIKDHAKTLNWVPSNTACRDLKEFTVVFLGDKVPGIVLSAQRTLRNLFSAFQTLYPSVEELHIFGYTWPFFASSYLQSLRALKSLFLLFRDTKYTPPEGSITLQSLQCLSIYGPAYFGSFHMPNLLKLTLELPDFGTWPTHLSHPRVRSLAITSAGSTQDFKVLSLDCTDLRDLRLHYIPLRVTWELLSLSNVVSITLASKFAGMVYPSSNQLCLALLCYPERLPSLQQLHFNNSIDWDVLFLMLQRRNIGQNGVKKIDTVTLPFIPFTLQQPLACILAAESMELPPLVSLSLEATREVMFDSTVAGCFACLQSMRPGCTARVSRRTDLEGAISSADDIYPVESIAVETTPAEIRDWLSLRRDLIDIWKASYDEFGQEYARAAACGEFPKDWL